MKERPMLFSGAMVRAILDGSKTQTRRVVKPQPSHEIAACEGGVGFFERKPNPPSSGYDVFKPPFGGVGDRIWVKETFGFALYFPRPGAVVYRADGKHEPAHKSLRGGRWKPSIFCTRKASRITLEIVSVRAERLQEISEADAKAEGVQPSESVEMKDGSPCYSLPYQILWNQINGVGSWAANPWVWVVEFRRVP